MYLSNVPIPKIVFAKSPSYNSGSNLLGELVFYILAMEMTIVDKAFLEYIESQPDYSEVASLLVSPENLIEPYKHLTFEITSLTDYLKLINLMQNDESIYWDVIYRGMDNFEYELLPGLGRYVFYLDSAEYELVHEVLKLRPEEFDSMKTDFDLLSKLQHFGLKTRLLDFTRNPLVALFFACIEEPDQKPGRVVCTLDESSPQSLELIERVCGLYQYDDYNGITLKDLLGDNITFDQYIARTRYPLYAQPSYSNERIRRQSGLFMVFTNVLMQHRFNSPGFEDAVPYMTKNGAISENSFISRMIARVDENILNTQFCSIIIPHSAKKQVLKELQTIGITEAYLFPELEYTVQWVNDRFSKMLINSNEIEKMEITNSKE